MFLTPYVSNENSVFKFSARVNLKFSCQFSCNLMALRKRGRHQKQEKEDEEEGKHTMRTVALGAFLAAQAAVAAYGLSSCGCSANCSVVGDSKVTAFDGSQTVTKESTFILYSAEKFELTANVSTANHYVESLHYVDSSGSSGEVGGIPIISTFTRDDCTKEGLLFNFTHRFQDNTTLNALIECWSPAARGVKDPAYATKSTPFYLNTHLTKNNQRVPGSFMTVEQSLGAHGACVRLTLDTGTCTCVGKCLAHSDLHNLNKVHITMFNGTDRMVKQASDIPSLEIYSSPHFQLLGHTDPYLSKVTFVGLHDNGREFVEDIWASNCTSRHQTMQRTYKLAPRGNLVSVSLTCHHYKNATDTGAHSQSWFSNVDLTKTDFSVPGNETFLSYEKNSFPLLGKAYSSLCLDGWEPWVPGPPTGTPLLDKHTTN